MNTCEIQDLPFRNVNCNENISHTKFKETGIPNSDEPKEISAFKELCLLDIQAEENAALMSLSPTQKKQQGVFFTPFGLSNLSARTFNYSKTDGVVLDPACGTGNLLLALAGTLEIFPSLEETLLHWNSKLHGVDINQKFIDIARKKIVRFALDRGAAPTSKQLLNDAVNLLSNIRVGDFLNEYKSYVGVVQSVIMNPPFCHINAPSDIDWTSGRFNAAALFVHYALQVLPDNGKFLGILPDVLRSGTRYSAWRHALFSCTDSKMETFGNFQRDVQVDVFILHGVKDSRKNQLVTINSPALGGTSTLLMDKFDVSVGPVVPHRDKLEGQNTPYAHAKILPPWETVDFLNERTLHTGKKFVPPFVAVRRTSSPKDKYRAVGTIVNCNEPVAVENHILVLSPKDKSLQSCQRLLDFLQSQFVNEYINSRIRCRHLTVGVIKEIPIERLIDGD